MKKLFNHFKYSNVAQSVLKMIAEVNNEEFHMMVAFHKPRFISLQPVVAKVIELVESETLQDYFRHSIKNARDATKRRELRQLETAATDTKFLLYVYFLGGCLPLLAEVNTKCQKRSALIWETYRELEKLIRVWIEPIVVDTSKPLSEVLEDENLKLASVDLFDEEALEDDINTMEQLLAVTDLELEELTGDFDDKVDFHGHRFMEYYREVVDNDLLTRQERSVVVQSCFNYMRSVGQGLLNRFPDLQFVLSHLAWVNPNNRNKHHITIYDVVKKFDDNEKYFDLEEIDRQYKKYRYDTVLEEFFVDDCKKDVTKFWCHLLKHMGGEYGELARLALLILCLSPDNMESERGVSVLNLVKTKHRNKLQKAPWMLPWG